MSTVSILMPVKNTSKYLSACIDSILAQTYKEWELIAVNDHSADSSQAILQSYTKLDDRIKCLNSSGVGIIAALRTAFSASTGTYITRMDSDDLMTPDKLQLFTTTLRKAGLGYLTTGLVKYISAEGIGNGYKNYEAWLNDLTAREDNFSDIYKECSIASPNWMLSRDDFVRCGAFDSDVYPEDYDLCFRWRAQNMKLRNVQSLTHYWRDYPTRTSRTDSNYADNKFSALKVQHFLSQDYDDNKELLLWGAGSKGKAIAKQLKENGVAFRWMCNNPKKIGHEIYGVEMEDSKLLSRVVNSQLILAVSQEGAETEMKKQLKTKLNSEVFFFC